MSDIFVQAAPQLGNQYRDDQFLRSYLQRKVPAATLSTIAPELEQLGEIAGGELYSLQLADRENEPTLVQWDAWGNRIDRIEVTPLWRRATQIAAQAGLIAIAYERTHGRYSRIHQFAAVYLFHPSSDVYTCPLAMTDGAARTLSVSKNAQLIARAVPRLTSRDPARAWTSGQWMTESTGGSDVGASLTRAERDEQGQWRLYGKKWFTSAITSQMALTLARPAGNGPGGSGLAMFYIETHDDAGRLNGMRVERLQRHAFGSVLNQLPLHVDTLAGLEAETRGAFLLAFELVELMGRQEAGELRDEQRALMRLLTPIAKLLTAKQAVAVVSECIEAFGGAGYVEDTGLPALLRDTQVLPIWEGTTNVLALDALLRGELTAALPAVHARIAQCVQGARDERLAAAGAKAEQAIEHVARWVREHGDVVQVQSHARRVAMTIGRALELAFLVEHARWELDAGAGRTSLAAAVRFAAAPVDLLVEVDAQDSRLLV